MDSFERRTTPQMSVSPEKHLSSNMKLVTSKSKSIFQVNDMPNKIHTTDDLKTFMSFLCDRHSIDMATAIKSSIEIFRYCIPSRAAVLAFYRELLDEYSTYYWILQKRSLGPNDLNRGKVEYVGELTRRFYELAQLKLADAREDQHSDFGGLIQPQSGPTTSPSKSASSIAGPASPTCSQSCSSPTPGPKIIPTTPRIIPVSRRTSSCNSNNMEQTPMSPSAQDIDDNLEDGIHYDTDVNAVDIFQELEELISLIRLTLDDIVYKYKLQDRHNVSSTHPTDPTDKQHEHFRKTLIDWASELLIHLDVKHNDIATQVALDKSKNNPSNLLKSEIELRLKNPVIELLVDVLLESHNDIQILFKRLINSPQSWDWLLAHILAELSRRLDRDKDFSSCMEYIIDCQTAAKSVTHILAYLSDRNPKAMANFPRSNIPFLISLCQTSASLLNVLAQEIPDRIDPEFLNKLAEEVYERAGSKSHPPCIANLAHCIISAPNSYRLFILTLEVRLDDRVSHHVKSAVQFIIDLILNRIQERALIQPMHNPQVMQIENLLDQIRNDPKRLIEKSISSKLIDRKAQGVFQRMSLIYGNTFASEIIGHYLNLPEESFWTFLRPLLNKFMKKFGDDGSFLVSQTLSLDSRFITPLYWRNINSLIVAMPELKLNLDLISRLLIDKLSAANFDITSVAQLIKLCLNSLEQVDHNKICISTKHKLCMSLATCFFLLLENGFDNFPETLSYIRISLTCMSLLKQSSVASHILCRALLERSEVYAYLFNPGSSDEGKFYDWNHNDLLKLSKENLGICHRFRRLPNRNEHKKCQHPDENKNSDPSIPDKPSINSYLLIEAFKSSIEDIGAFADLLVEFLCPVVFDKQIWPSEDALRTINEKNLSLIKKFEQVPPLWDLYELIGQAGCLKRCLVLVKLLLAGHLAIWASATTTLFQDKLISIQRLLPPLAQSKLIPEAFALTVEVFPHLAANQVFLVLKDIWHYLKDTTETNLSSDEEKLKAKAHLERLRFFMCQHTPGPLYVKIYKNLST